MVTLAVYSMWPLYSVSPGEEQLDDLMIVEVGGQHEGGDLRRVLVLLLWPEEAVQLVGPSLPLPLPAPVGGVVDDETHQVEGTATYGM